MGNQYKKDTISKFFSSIESIFEDISMSIVMLDDESKDMSLLEKVSFNLTQISSASKNNKIGEIEALSNSINNYIKKFLSNETKDCSQTYHLISEAISFLQDALNELNSNNLIKTDMVAFIEKLETGGIGTMSEKENTVKQFVVPVVGAGLVPVPAFRATTRVAPTNSVIEPDFEGVNLSEDPDLFSEFIFESNGHLETIEEKLLALENEPENTDLINEIFRPFHSAKGSSGFLGLTKINKICHESETLLDGARKGRFVIDSEIVDVLLSALDTLKKLLVNLSAKLDQGQGKSDPNGPIAPIDINLLLQRLSRLVEKKVTGSATESKPSVETTTQKVEQPQKSPLERGLGCVNQTFHSPQPTSSEKEKETKPKMLGEILVDMGEITEDQLDSALQLQNKPVGEILIKQGIVTADKVEKALEVQRAQGKKITSAIKVDTEKLDNILNLVGELVITQTMISESPIIQKMLDQNIYKDISQLGKIIKDMQRQVMSLRMIPIKPTFQRMTRLVRDLSKQANKKVELQLSGEDTELDKTVIEEIGDPLVHLIRNSIDHGLESEEERITGGKPPVGTILLNAYHQGGNIVIEVVDDGRGLNKEKIIKKAKEKGLISSESILTDSEIYNLIFLPGFSTTEKVTAVSGRGVGMDVVRMNIEKLKGQVELSTEEGKWTKTTIKLPLTLAIIDGMLVRIDKDKFIISTLSIIESIRPEKKDIYTVEGSGEIVNVRGKILPLVRLNRIFGLKSEKQEPWEGLVVVVESEGNRCCLFVDDLIGQQQVVIKSLGEKLRNVKGIAGGAILGDGRVGLILDVAGIMELVFK